MRQQTVGLVAAFLTAPAAWATGSNSVPGLESRMIVQVYNRAHVSGRLLNAAEKEAAWLYEGAGITIQWVDCTREDCVETNDPRVLVLSIERSASSGATKSALGLAFPFEPRAHRAEVFLSRVEAFSPEYPEFLFGGVIAHELAHLLFRTNSHGSGLMKAALTPADLAAMSMRILRFTPKQARELREGLNDRTSTLLSQNED